MIPPARTPQQRQADTLRRLEHDTDAWVATAEPGSGTPYMVPLSFLWDGATVLIATPAASPTSRNLQATGQVRLGIGPTRDVVLIEGTVQAVTAAADIPVGTGDAFARRDPEATQKLQPLIWLARRCTRPRVRDGTPPCSVAAVSAWMAVSASGMIIAGCCIRAGTSAPCRNPRMPPEPCGAIRPVVVTPGGFRRSIGMTACDGGM